MAWDMGRAEAVLWWALAVVALVNFVLTVRLSNRAQDSAVAAKLGAPPPAPLVTWKWAAFVWGGAHLRAEDAILTKRVHACRFATFIFAALAAAFVYVSLVR